MGSSGSFNPIYQITIWCITLRQFDTHEFANFFTKRSSDLAVAGSVILTKTCLTDCLFEESQF